MKTKLKLAFSTAMFMAFSGFTAYAAPGVSSHILARCSSEPHRVGDAAVGGKYAAVVSYRSLEFTSFYQVEIFDSEKKELIEVLTGVPNQQGTLVLQSHQGVSIPGFSNAFTLDGMLASWTNTRDFGDEEVINFICLK